MTNLEIRLFGAIEIRHQGTLLTDFRSQKALVLLAYLICVDRPVTREHLAGLAWPDTEQGQALGLLRRTLHDLTSKLPDCLAVDRRTVHFQPQTPVIIDAHSVAELMVQNDVTAWAQAVDLYRALFLEGIYLDGAPELEHWLLREQEQWQQQIAALLDRLVSHHTAEGVYDRALHYARRLVALEPWREEAHCQVMVLLARTGQVSAALAQYHTCRQRLWTELSIEPAESTQSLYIRLQSVARRPVHKLPQPTTPLIGRETELNQLTRWLAAPHCRLITLVGVGGIGKTRLALDTARRVVNDTVRMFFHGTYFVPLASVDTATQMMVTMAQTLGLSLQNAATPDIVILNHLRDKELLLVLDNVEQLIDEQSLHFLVQVLDAAPEVKLLVTSRARLGLHREQLYSLQGLQVPTTEQTTLTSATADAYSALQLWIEAVRLHTPDYVVTPDELPVLVTISRQVQGLPLAIELAAAWHGRLSLAAIAAELAHNLDFLTSRAPDLPLRQRSLRAVFQTSWRLLNPPQQQRFPRLALFRGGFTVALAKAVADIEPALLQDLLDQSLVNCSEVGRYHLHEIIRQFAGEQLAATGQQRDTQHRHATALLELIQQIDPPSRYFGDRPGITTITTEYDNIQAALHWCFGEGEEVLGLQLVAALRDYWYIANNWLEGRRWQERALTVPISDDLFATRAIVLSECGTLHHVMSEIALAETAYRESLAIFEAQNDLREQAWTLFHLARPEYQQRNNAACDALLLRALALFRRLVDERGVASVLQRLAMQMMDGAHDLIQAEQFAQESLTIARRLDARGTIAGSLILLGEIVTRQHDLAQAETYLTESLALPETHGGMRAWALGKLGRVLLLHGKPQEAERIFREALQIRQEIGSPIGVAWMLECLGEVAVATEHYAQAVPMFGIAHTLRTSKNAPLSAHDRQLFDQLVQKAQAALGEEQFTLAWHKGKRLAQAETDFAAWITTL